MIAEPFMERFVDWIIDFLRTIQGKQGFSRKCFNPFTHASTDSYSLTWLCSLVEISFVELEADPLMVVSNIYRALGWEWFSDARPQMEGYLEEMQGFKKN